MTECIPLGRMTNTSQNNYLPCLLIPEICTKHSQVALCDLLVTSPRIIVYPQDMDQPEYPDNDSQTCECPLLGPQGRRLHRNWYLH